MAIEGGIRDLYPLDAAGTADVPDAKAAALGHAGADRVVSRFPPGFESAHCSGTLSGGSFGRCDAGISRCMTLSR